MRSGPRAASEALLTSVITLTFIAIGRERCVLVWKAFLQRHCKADTYIINTLAKGIQTCSKVVNYVMAAISWTKSLTCDEDHINLKNGIRPLVRIFQVLRVKTQTRCPMKKKPSVENFSSPMAG